MSDDWLTMTACDLGRGIDAGDIDPVALTEAYLAAADAHPFGADIYARMTADRALAEAAAARHRAAHGTRASLLDGVPISWKDLYDTAGVATESGSRLLQGRTPDRDARVLANAAAAGIVCLGKTHQTELAFSGLGVNPQTATPPNGRDALRAPGGSSSGAGVSVAVGLAAAGIGSDTGGSVRIPAAWNDLVGLKTTHGLLSLDGVVPLCPSFDTVGPLTRSVEDAAHLTAAMAGTRPADLRGATLAGKRFLICETVAMEACEEEPVAAVSAAVDRLTAAGATVDRAEIPEVADAMALAGLLFPTEAYATWGATIEANPDVMFAPVRERFLFGKDAAAYEVIRAWTRLRDLRRAIAARTVGYDAMLAPTSPILPPVTAKLLEDHAYFVERNLLALRNTRIANLLGLCALTLPTGRTHCGLMLMAPALGEGALLRTGAAAEAALR